MREVAVVPYTPDHPLGITVALPGGEQPTTLPVPPDLFCVPLRDVKRGLAPGKTDARWGRWRAFAPGVKGIGRAV